MRSITTPIVKLKKTYDAIVIGSGYGGGISASRLSRGGLKVCVLEKGKEFLAGDFPGNEIDAAKELQVHTDKTTIGDKNGLFNFHVYKDINVLSGCGLGGTSLINANVSLKADERVFDDPKWPAEIRANRGESLTEGYRLASEMLCPNPYPVDGSLPELKKMTMMKTFSGNGIKGDYYPTPINVTFKERVNSSGVHQDACNLCGDCITGCNHTAKNTVQMNYLPDAFNHGAEIFTECDVRYIRKRDDGMHEVFFEPMALARSAFEKTLMFVEAKIVVVSAGSLGSTEIMLRSKKEGLRTSSQVGKRFSGNGDVLAFAYNLKDHVNGIGYGNSKVNKEKPAGPCIASVIDTRSHEDNYQDGLIIEEGVIPGTLKEIAAASFFALSGLSGQHKKESFFEHMEKAGEVAMSLIGGSHDGATSRTQTFLVMAHDGDDGRISMTDDDHLSISWPGVGKRKIFETINDTLKGFSETGGGTFIANPMWLKSQSHPLVSVHPLGGCVMADDASDGVVNHKGQVYVNDSGTEVDEGLYILDGSIIPVCLGVNPLYTISAVAERNVALMAKDHGFNIDYASTNTAKYQEIVNKKPGVTFTEKMKGVVSDHIDEEYLESIREYDSLSEFEFLLTILSDDVEDMMKSSAHQADMTGTVICDALSPKPLTVHDGVFNLFTNVTDDGKEKRMEYTMKLVAESGEEFWFHGYKKVKDKGKHIWHDTSTLYIDIYKDAAKTQQILKGILKIELADFRKQMTTMKIVNAHNGLQKIELLARFGAFFSQSVAQVYF